MVTIEIHAKDSSNMLHILNELNYKISFKERIGNSIKYHIETTNTSIDVAQHIGLHEPKLLFNSY